MQAAAFVQKIFRILCLTCFPSLAPLLNSSFLDSVSPPQFHHLTSGLAFSALIPQLLTIASSTKRFIDFAERITSLNGLEVIESNGPFSSGMKVQLILLALNTGDHCKAYIYFGSGLDNKAEHINDLASWHNAAIEYAVRNFKDLALGFAPLLTTAVYLQIEVEGSLDLTVTATKLEARLALLSNHHRALLAYRAPFQLIHHVPLSATFKRAASPSLQASSRQRSEEPAPLSAPTKITIAPERPPDPPYKKPRTVTWRPSLQGCDPWPDYESASRDFHTQPEPAIPRAPSPQRSSAASSSSGTTSGPSAKVGETLPNSTGTDLHPADAINELASSSTSQQWSSRPGAQTIELPTPSPRLPPLTAYDTSSTRRPYAWRNYSWDTHQALDREVDAAPRTWQERTTGNRTQTSEAFSSPRPSPRSAHVDPLPTEQVRPAPRVWRSRDFDIPEPVFAPQQQAYWTDRPAPRTAYRSAAAPPLSKAELLNSVSAATRRQALELSPSDLNTIIRATSSPNVNNRPSYFAAAVRRKHYELT